MSCANKKKFNLVLNPLFFFYYFPCVSSALEREMSARQSREELIKRGVLKEIFEKGERIFIGFLNGSSQGQVPLSLKRQKKPVP